MILIRPMTYMYVFVEKKSDYGKYPNILYPKVANKMKYANSADPDQTAPEGTV